MADDGKAYQLCQSLILSSFNLVPSSFLLCEDFYDVPFILNYFINLLILVLLLSRCQRFCQM